MDLSLKGKTAFISGSTSGIGFAIAKSLVEEGVQVILNGRSQVNLKLAIASIKESYPNASIEGLVSDFSREEEVEELLQKLPAVDILVNNVGVYASESFYATSDAEWFRQFEVNVMSGVRLSRQVLPMMLSQDWGRILFISSECAAIVPADLIAYSTTKAAILAVSRGLAQLAKGSGVTVNTIIPGSTLSEGAERFLEEVARKEEKTPQEVEGDFFKKVRTSSLLQRFASVEEVAKTVTYFASPLAAATNGAAIKVDGGSMGGIL